VLSLWGARAAPQLIDAHLCPMANRNNSGTISQALARSDKKIAVWPANDES
jgi:hypothetical protein